MRALERTFPVITAIGLTALVASMAVSNTTEGTLFGMHPFALSLRFFGIGYLAGGGALWVALCRRQGGDAFLSPLLMILVFSGLAALCIDVLLPLTTISPHLHWIGLGASLVALMIAVIAQSIDPVYPTRVSVAWPEGGVNHPDPHVPALDLRRPEFLSVAPDDLTAIRGIGPEMEKILNQAGVVSYRDLLRRAPDEIETIIRDSHIRAPIHVEDWRKQAEKLVRNGRQVTFEF